MKSNKTISIQDGKGNILVSLTAEEAKKVAEALVEIKSEDINTVIILKRKPNESK